MITGSAAFAGGDRGRLRPFRLRLGRHRRMLAMAEFDLRLFPMRKAARLGFRRSGFHRGARLYRLCEAAARAAAAAARALSAASPSALMRAAMRAALRVRACSR